MLLVRPPDILIFVQMAPDIATCMCYTGVDPFTKEEVYIARNLRDRKLQRVPFQFFKPENYFTVREALIQAGRQDLIGGGCDCLIPAQPPREAIEARRRRTNEASRGDHYHSVANPAKGEPAGERGLPNQGYRPRRKTAHRQDKSANVTGTVGLALVTHGAERAREVEQHTTIPPSGGAR